MFSITFKQSTLNKWWERIVKLSSENSVLIFAVTLASLATAYSFLHGYITAYGDAESHLNIAKRVVDSLTPGFAQLGGIWLPLPHLLMVPLVKFDFLWRSGLAGSIVSGAAFVVSCVYLYRLAFLLTRNKVASFVSSLVFMVNPNVLYLQTTPMTELVLIVFFILSSFYFIKFLEDDRDLLSLVLAAFFGLCAALSRYDGWSLVLMEAGILFLLYLPWKEIPRKWAELKSRFDAKRWERLQGRLILFSTLAFFGILIWFAWDFLILGDPLYFTHSQFSAKSQQNNWLVRGELPSYHSVLSSLSYYSVTSMSNVGILVSVLAVAGFVYFFYNRGSKHRFYALLILLVPFIFNVATLFLGQSVIFIPSLTPLSFEWRLFNVRYGVMMVPFAAIFVAFLFYKLRASGKLLVVSLLVLQIAMYLVGYSRVITLDDGVTGLSSATAKLPDAQFWFSSHYDKGLVLVDDYARTMSVIRTHVPMQNIIYVGNKPYWGDSLKEPQKYATWIIMQKNDDVWNNVYERPEVQGQLFKYFQKVYTSPDILIFKRNTAVANNN